MLYKTAFEGFSCLEYAKRNCQPGSKLLHECYTAGKVQCVSSRDITSLKHTLVYSEYGQTMENCKNLPFFAPLQQIQTFFWQGHFLYFLDILKKFKYTSFRWQKVDINYHPTVTRAPFLPPSRCLHYCFVRNVCCV